MEVFFDKRFTKDVKKIKNPALKQKIKTTIEQIEQADSLKAVSRVKKLQGHTTAYRIRVGNYRLGFFLLDQNTLELVRVLHRKDIYSNFP